MKKFKILAILLVLMMVLVSCGQNKSSDEPSTDPDNTGAPDTPIVSASGATIPLANEIKIPEGKVIKVGYLAQNETDQFNVFMSQALRAEAEKFGASVKLEVADGQSQAATQVSQAEDMVAKGMDVVIINCIDQNACAPAVKGIVDAGIPLITVNTVPVNNDLATAYVGVNDILAGEVAMQIMADALGGKGTVNVILGLLGHPASENRWTGMQNVLKNYPDIKIAASQPADWDRAKAMAVTEDWISSGNKFDGIIACNDEMAISAAHALSAANVEGVKIVGVDAIDEALALVKSGKMTGTVFQDAVSQGRGSLDIALAAVLGMEIEKEYVIPFQSVTKDNVDDYLGE